MNPSHGTLVYDPDRRIARYHHATCGFHVGDEELVRMQEPLRHPLVMEKAMQRYTMSSDDRFLFARDLPSGQGVLRQGVR